MRFVSCSSYSALSVCMYKSVCAWVYAVVTCSVDGEGLLLLLLLLFSSRRHGSHKKLQQWADYTSVDHGLYRGWTSIKGMSQMIQCSRRFSSYGHST